MRQFYFIVSTPFKYQKFKTQVQFLGGVNLISLLNLIM